jgi:hypothetical protein
MEKNGIQSIVKILIDENCKNSAIVAEIIERAISEIIHLTETDEQQQIINYFIHVFEEFEPLFDAVWRGREAGDKLRNLCRIAAEEPMAECSDRDKYIAKTQFNTYPAMERDLKVPSEYVIIDKKIYDKIYKMLTI